MGKSKKKAKTPAKASVNDEEEATPRPSVTIEGLGDSPRPEERSTSSMLHASD